MTTASGTFDVHLQPGPSELGGSVGRFEFDKVWHGDLEATGTGIMLTGGDPQTGSAGYVAIETVRGRLGDRQGGFAFQQLGTVQGGAPALQYTVVPGSGTGELAGLTGALELTVDDDDGTHRYQLEYDV